MSKIEELIKELCPDGVKYKKLSDIGLFFKGMSGVSNKWADKGNCQFIDFKNVYDNIKVKVNVLPFATVKKQSNQNSLSTGDILFTSASETPDECAISSVIENNIPDGIFLDDHLFGLRLYNQDKELNPVFFNYYFKTEAFRKNVMKTVRGVTRFYISMDNFKKISVPVPPIEIQEKIVEILDKFTDCVTELTAELTAELTLRRKQYEYYTNILLSFDKKTPSVQLRNISDFRNGKGHEKDIVADGKYTVVNSKFISTSGEVKKYSNKQICPLYTDDIVMVMSDLPNGRALAKCFVVEENDKYSLNQRIGAFHVKDENIIITKFLYYVLNRNRQLLRYDNGVDQTNLRKDDILDIWILLPSMSEQKHIVSILDRFDTLCNNLTGGLPAEIEARQKQYEYYRDKLLTFKPLKD